MPRANCMTFEKDQDEQENGCQLIRKKINGVPVVFLVTEESDVEEKKGRPIQDVAEEERKRPRTREPARRSSQTNQRALTVPPNRSTNKDMFWATLTQSVNLEELSERTLYVTVLGVMVRDLLSILPHLIQQWFGIKRVPPINKEKAEPQINSAK